MQSSLTGRTVALAEGRQQEDLARLLEKEGATAWRCPMLNILDAPDSAAVEGWIKELCDGGFDLVILMTGEAVRRLLGFANRAGLRDAAVEALRKTPTLTRGPKPVQALKEIGVVPTYIASQPTTQGVIETLQSLGPLTGKTVAYTLYGDENPTLADYLKRNGATAKPVLTYVYAPAADADRVAELIKALAAGRIDAILFTSSPQVDRLFEVAKEQRLEDELRAGLARTCVAAVGPLVRDNLERRGCRIDVCPEQGFVMKNLVQQLKRAFE
ncbi:MAG: uroporphyrinogen III methyltransferase [Gemmatales bacterium]|nr:MAG: uroporphyrinogen III methyltransferase [Gemmatales bacterium]